MTFEFEPMRVSDCLKLVDMIRLSLQSQRTSDGCLSPLGIKAIFAIVECLEAKLANRAGPHSAGTDGSQDP